MSGVSIRSRTVASGRRYDVRYRRGGRYSSVEHGGTFVSKREAEIRRDAIRDWLAAGLNPKVELRRVGTPARDLAATHDAFIASRRRITEGTRAGLRHRQKRIDEDLGSFAVDELTVEDVIGWVGELEADYKPGTVGLFVRQLRQVLDFAGVPNVARDRRVEIPRNVQREPDPPDAGDVVFVLEKVAANLVLPIVALEQLGSRISETLALLDSDLGDDYVRFRRETTKGQRQGRRVECDPLLAEALARRVPFRLGRDSVGSAMRAVGPVHPHLLRHRRATLWHQAGVPAVELARRLGHARASMSLDVYANVKPLREIPAHELSAFLR